MDKVVESTHFKMNFDLEIYSHAARSAKPSKPRPTGSCFQRCAACKQFTKQALRVMNDCAGGQAVLVVAKSTVERLRLRA